MAVIIEKTYPYLDYSEENAKVTAAVLPSGKVLAAPGVNASMLLLYSEKWHPHGWDKMLMWIKSAYKSPYSKDIWLIEDPKEARKLIQEAGLEVVRLNGNRQEKA